MQCRDRVKITTLCASLKPAKWMKGKNHDIAELSRERRRTPESTIHFLDLVFERGQVRYGGKFHYGTKNPCKIPDLFCDIAEEEH